MEYLRTGRLIALAGTLLAMTACQGPTGSTSPSTNPTPTPGPRSATGWFGEVAGWEFVDAPDAGRDFEDLANAAVEGLGSVRVEAASEATPIGVCCSANVIAFSLAPEPGHTESELVRAIVEAIPADAEPGPACNEQAVSVVKGGREVILGPWAGGRSPFLVSDGPAIGSAREIFSLLIGAGSGGCAS
jgi:hypothetical protein